MIERIEHLPAGVIGLRARGEVTRQDYERVVEPTLDAARSEGRRVRFLFHFPPDFERFTAGAAWADFKVGLRHLRLFERCAVVSDKAWLRGTTQAFGFVMPGRVRVFDEPGLAEAIAWLAEGAEPPTLTHRYVADAHVLVLEPHGPLRAEDFDHIAAVVDPWIEQHGRLAGLVVHAEQFPGWEDMESMFRHLRFVRDHHQKVERVALCAGGRMARLAPALAKHFVRAKIEQFAYDDLDKAVAWAAGRA